MSDSPKPEDDRLGEQVQDARPDDGALPRAHLRARLEQALFGVAAEPVRIGRYLVLERLGQGGMGVVYSAYDPELDRRVALKLLGGRHGPEARARLEREARALARLSHPNVVPVHDVGVLEDGQVFVVMEMVRGQNLGAYVRAAPRTWRQILEVYLQAARGLAAAHAVGLVHRDVKPENALVGEDGRVRVLDFGLAQPDSVAKTAPGELPAGATPPAATRSLTRTGALMGTPAYMSPEQFASARVGPRSDQFSFCVALHEALYGQHPFAGDTLAELRDNISAGRRREPPRGARVPGWIAPLIRRGLEPGPDARHPSMDALISAFERKTARTGRRALALALVLAIAFAGLAVLLRAREDPGASACSGGAPAIDAVWSQAARDRLAAALRRTGVPYAERAWDSVAGGLERYATSWASMHREACLAHVRGEQSAALLDTRMACLWRRRDALASAISVLGEVDASSLEHAMQVVRGLPSVAACADVAALAAAVPLPEDAEVARQVTALEQRLDRAETLEHAGRYVEGRGQAQDVVRAAKALGYEPLTARALLLDGRMAMLQRQLEEADSTLDRALLTGLAAGVDDIAGEALARRVYALGMRDPREALGLVGLGEALARRVGERTFVHALLLNNAGTVHLARGERDEARRAFERALDLTQRATAEQPIELINILSNLAMVSRDPARREALMQRAVAEMTRALGPEHPRTLYLRVAHGLQVQDPERALGILTPACTLYERYHPDIERELVDCFYALGGIEAELGRQAQAAAHLARVAERLTAAARAPGAKPSIIGAIAAGYAHLYERRPGEAARELAAAVASLEAHPSRPWWIEQRRVEALLGLGLAALAQGRDRQAVEALEAALAALDALGPACSEVACERTRAHVQMSLARALWNRGSRERARALMRRAAAWYAGAGPGYEARRAAIARWQRERGLTPGEVTD